VHEVTLPAREIVQATRRTRIFHIDLGPERFDFTAGQAVFAGLAESAVRRPYSIACSPGQARRFNAIELLVQIDDHQPPDPHLERVVPGTLLRIQGPFGSFSLPQDFDSASLLLIAGGTGIAPLRAIMWDVLERHSDTGITLLYSARTPEEFAYLAELRELAARGVIELVLTTTRGASAPWQGLQGRVNQDLIARTLRADGHAVICGPASLVADATTMLQALGVPQNRILTETYAG
jgi:NAD(P)H-flavin reductase